MPVLSWSLGCQPEYGKPEHPEQHPASSAQAPASPRPHRTRHRQRQNRRQQLALHSPARPTPSTTGSAAPGTAVILGQPYPFRGRATRPARSELGPPAPCGASTPRPVLPARQPRTRFLERPDWPDPQSQSLSRSYGSRLPISLTYINLSTRGSEPRRPDAEMGTVCVETGHFPSAGKANLGERHPCDFLTYIFHGLALVHGTTQELCRSTATVWF